MSLTTPPDAWESTFDFMLTEWITLESPLVQADWDVAFASMVAEAAELKRRGDWRSGKRTLLAELGLQYQEVLMCRGLAWLLTPDAWHGLGTLFLTEFLTSLEQPTHGADRAVITLEEARAATRADLVLRYPGGVVLLEAKILAGEQATQADRLAREWAGEHPTLVFLTRSGRAPLTAVESAGLWRSLSWLDIARMAESAASRASQPSPGALDLIETLKRYGG